MGFCGRVVALLFKSHQVQGLAWAIGGGRDWNASRHFAIRTAQLDYQGNRSPGNGKTITASAWRYAVGVVLTFLTEPNSTDLGFNTVNTLPGIMGGARASPPEQLRRLTTNPLSWLSMKCTRPSQPLLPLMPSEWVVPLRPKNSAPRLRARSQPNQPHPWPTTTWNRQSRSLRLSTFGVKLRKPAPAPAPESEPENKGKLQKVVQPAPKKIREHDSATSDSGTAVAATAEENGAIALSIASSPNSSLS